MQRGIPCCAAGGGVSCGRYHTLVVKKDRMYCCSQARSARGAARADRACESRGSVSSATGEQRALGGLHRTLQREATLFRTTARWEQVRSATAEQRARDSHGDTAALDVRQQVLPPAPPLGYCQRRTKSGVGDTETPLDMRQQVSHCFAFRVSGVGG